VPGAVYFAMEILINLRYTGTTYTRVLHFITDEVTSNSQFSVENSHTYPQFHTHTKLQTRLCCVL